MSKSIEEEIINERAEQLEKIGFEFKVSETSCWYQKGEVKMIPTLMMCASEYDWQKFIKDNSPQPVAIPIAQPVEGEKEDCSKHKKEVAGISDMKVLAEMIGDLHYESLTEFVLEFARKINADSVRDSNSGKRDLSMELFTASCHLETAYESIQQAWQISKPFMQPNK